MLPESQGFARGLTGTIHPRFLVPSRPRSTALLGGVKVGKPMRERKLLGRTFARMQVKHRIAIMRHLKADAGETPGHVDWVVPGSLHLSRFLAEKRPLTERNT